MTRDVDHCEACGAPDDGTQTYCDQCGEPLVDPKYIRPDIAARHAERAMQQHNPQYAYTLTVGQRFTLPGDTAVRTVVALEGRGVDTVVLDDMNERISPGTVVEQRF